MRIIFGALTGILLAWCAEPAKQAETEHLQAQKARASGRITEAEAHYSKALQFWDEAGQEYHHGRCMTLINLGQLHVELQKITQAEKELTEASALAEQFQSADPLLYAEALSRLGALYGQNEQTERGRPLLTKAIALLASEHGRELAFAQNSLGLIDVAERHPASAEAHLREAVRLSELSQDPEHTFAYQTNLALALIRESKYDRAETLLSYIRAGLEKLPEVPQQLLGTVLAELSAIAVTENKLSIAEEYARQELTAIGRQNPTNPLAMALARVHLATVYIEERRLDEAERILPDAVEEERRLPANSASLANAVRRLAELRALQQSWPESQALYREAINLYKTAPAGVNQEANVVQHEYAAVLKKGRGSKVQAGLGFRPGRDTVRPN